MQEYEKKMLRATAPYIVFLCALVPIMHYGVGEQTVTAIVQQFRVDNQKRNGQVEAVEPPQTRLQGIIPDAGTIEERINE